LILPSKASILVVTVAAQLLEDAKTTVRRITTIEKKIVFIILLFSGYLTQLGT
jgi:hypothetical protein